MLLGHIQTAHDRAHWSEARVNIDHREHMYLTEVPLVFWTGDPALCGGLADSLFRPPI